MGGAITAAFVMASATLITSQKQRTAQKRAQKKASADAAASEAQSRKAETFAETEGQGIGQLGRVSLEVDDDEIDEKDNVSRLSI